MTYKCTVILYKKMMGIELFDKKFGNRNLFFKINFKSDLMKIIEYFHQNLNLNKK